MRWCRPTAGSSRRRRSGIYSTKPTDLKSDDSATLQSEIDARESPPHVAHPAGWAVIETYTVVHGSGGRKTGIVIGRLDDGGGRFLAQVAEGDDELMELLETAEQPVGERVYVTAFGYGNRVTRYRRDRRDAVSQARTARLRDDYEFIKVHRDGHLLEVTIDRPDVRNCLHPPAHEELDEVFDAFFADRDLWVAIITGEGTKAFCAGNDLIYSASGKPMYVPFSGFGGLTGRRHMHKPVIAAVNGFAMGGGFEIALACHLVVADESAKFALSEVKVGLVAGAGGVIRLPRSIPPKVANELILTGRRIGAEEARQLGVVNRVAPEGQALAAARELAAEILAASPTSVRLSLKLMEQTQGIADTVDAVTAPLLILDELMTSADAIEGMTAFALKRQPEWKNHVSSAATADLAAFDDSVAGVIDKFWGDATAAENGDVSELWAAAAEQGWFELGYAEALDLAVAATRRLGRAACPLPVLDGYAAAELFEEPGVASGDVRLVLTGDPTLPVDAGGAATHVLAVPTRGGMPAARHHRSDVPAWPGHPGVEPGHSRRDVG